MFIKNRTLADAVGALTDWAGVANIEALTVHCWDGHAGDTWRFWGSLVDETDGSLGEAVELLRIDGGASVVVASANALVQLAPFPGVIAVELDVDGGAPAAGGRQVRIMGVHR